MKYCYIQPYDKATFGTMTKSKHILLTAIIGFGKSAFPELADLSKQLQVFMVESCRKKGKFCSGRSPWISSIDSGRLNRRIARTRSSRSIQTGQWDIAIFVSYFQLLDQWKKVAKIDTRDVVFISVCPFISMRHFHVPHFRIFAGFTYWLTHNYDEHYFSDCPNPIDKEHVMTWALDCDTFSPGYVSVIVNMQIIGKGLCMASLVLL